MWSESWTFTAGFAVIVTGAVASTAVTVVRECRKNVVMQSVAEAELRILRPLAVAAVRAEVVAADEWVVTEVDCAEEELRHGRGAWAAWLLCSVAELICETDLDGSSVGRAAASRDRLQETASRASAFAVRGLGDHSVV